MCIAVGYEINNVAMTPFFTHLKARLPVLSKDQSIQPVVWGRRESETGNLPEAAGLFLDNIKQGQWDEFFPQPVKLPLLRFAMQAAKQKTVWFELLKEQLVQGVVLRFNSEVRCYCVYVKTYQPGHPFTFWPRILYRGEQLSIL